MRKITKPINNTVLKFFLKTCFSMGIMMREITRKSMSRVEDFLLTQHFNWNNHPLGSIHGYKI